MLNGEIDHILFEDEAMIRDYQAIGKTWFLKGHQKIIPTYGKHYGVKLLGTLNYETGEVFVVENEAYNAEVFLSFLKSILEKYPEGKLALVLDNARIQHAKLIQPFLEENKHRIEFHFLPPYSPNLNCIEKFWGWLKQSCIHNVFFSSAIEIRAAVQKFVKKVNEASKETIDRVCLLGY